MSDSANLTVGLDTSPILAGINALNAFTAAAKPAASAANIFQNSASGSSSGLGAVSKSLEQAVGDFQVLAVAQKNGTTAGDENSESLRGQRQVLRAISTDLAIFGGGLGQVAGTAGLLYTENAHLIEGFGGFKNAISGIVTPTNILVGALAAVAIGGALAIESFVQETKAFADFGDKTDTAVQSLRGLNDAADEIATADFLKGMEQFGTLSLQAKNNIGGLAELFHANGDAISGSMVENLEKVADLVSNATSESQKYQILQEAGLPATREWVNYLSQGGASLKQAVADGDPLTAQQQQLIDKAKELSDTFHSTWETFKSDAQNAAITTYSFFDDLAVNIRGAINSAANAGGWNDAYQRHAGKSLLEHGQGTQLNASDANDIYNKFGTDFSKPTSGNGKKTVTAADAKKQIQDQQQSISILGQQASVSDIVKQKQLELQSASLNGINITEKQRDSILAYTQAEALGTAQMQQQTSAAYIQAEAVGMSVGAAAAFTSEQEKLAEFAQRGIVLTQAQTDALHAYAQALGVATQAVATKKLQDETNFNTSQLGRNDIDANTASQLKEHLRGRLHLAH